MVLLAIDLLVALVLVPLRWVVLLVFLLLG
jgi:hypothetical protein